MLVLHAALRYNLSPQLQEEHSVSPVPQTVILLSGPAMVITPAISRARAMDTHAIKHRARKPAVHVKDGHVMLQDARKPVPPVISPPAPIHAGKPVMIPPAPVPAGTHATIRAQNRVCPNH